LVNRKYHGGTDKACYLYSANHYPFWKDKFPKLDWQWGMFGENLTVEGLDESKVKIGDVYRIGTAVVQVSQPRQPCFKLGIRFEDQIAVDMFWQMPFPGIYVRIVEQGEVSNGDHLVLVKPNSGGLSVSEVYSVFSSRRNDISLIQRALAEPYLAESCRKDIQKIYDALT